MFASMRTVTSHLDVNGASITDPENDGEKMCELNHRNSWCRHQRKIIPICEIWWECLFFFVSSFEVQRFTLRWTGVQPQCCREWPTSPQLTPDCSPLHATMGWDAISSPHTVTSVILIVFLFIFIVAGVGLLRVCVCVLVTGWAFLC